MKKTLFLFSLFLFACEAGQFGTMEKNTVGGTILGAGLGAVIGHETGNTGAGVAIGSAAGALAGGLLGNQIENQEEAIENRESQIARQEAMLEENRRLLEELRRRGLDARSTSRGIVANLPDVLFNVDEASLRPDAIRAVNEIADVVQNYPERRISVEGHTDSTGAMEYNQNLSEQRAYSVADELVGAGISRRRINAYGFGESSPIATNNSATGRQKNRRVEVVVQNY